MALDPITAVLGLGDTLIKRLWPDPETADKAKLELAGMAARGELAKLAEAAGIVRAEANSEHWIVAAWRPITMLILVFIVANNYIIAPYAAALFDIHDLTLPIPPDLWQLIRLGLGGYIMGRSGEKIVNVWQAKRDRD